MFYLSVVSGKWQMMFSRSQDLISWEHATTTDFMPSSDEGVNNSDVDFVEKEGQTILSMRREISRPGWGFDGPVIQEVLNPMLIDFSTQQFGLSMGWASCFLKNSR